MIKDKNILNIANKQKVLLPVILISNLMPLYGVIQYGWTIFTVVYIYWFELLIVSFFQFLKILLAEGNTKISIFTKFFIAIRFLLLRIGIFIFYLIFIVVFLGILPNVNNKDNENLKQMSNAIFLQSDFFRFTILSFIFYNFLDFLFSFIINNQYKTALPNNFNIFLDIRIIVVHIVVILGTFLYEGITNFLHLNHKIAMIACVSLFIVVKLIADIIRGWSNDEDTSREIGKYI